MRNVGLHSALYGLLLMAIMWIMPLDSSFSSDAGAYGGQVFALRQGGWALARPVAVVDEVNEGWLNTSITPDGPTPYTANPAYSLLLTGAVGIVHGPAEADDGGQRAGDLAPGLHLLPILGAVAAAAVAWKLAEQWDKRAAPLSFWLLALGPVLVNATTLWAHTLSSAFGGVALVFALRTTGAAGRPGARHGPGERRAVVVNGIATAAALAGGALLRTEALFWIAAVMVAAVLARQGRLHIATMLGAGASASIVWFVARSLGRGLRSERLPIETSVQALSGSTGWLDSRLPAAWRLLLTSLTPGVGPLLTLLAVVLATLGAFRLGRPHDQGRRAAAALLLAAAVLYGARLVVAPAIPISGALGAWPLIVVLPLAGAVRRRTGAAEHGQPAGSSTTVESRPSSLPFAPVEQRPPPLLAPVAACAVLLGAVLLTQHATSGGLQWGGRYLSMGFVPMAAIAAVLGREAFRRRPLPMVALLVLPAVLGVTATYRLNATHRAIVDQAVAIPADVVVTELPALPRIAWSELPTAFYRATESDLEPLLDRLAAGGVATVNVHGLSGVEVDGLAGYRQTATRDGLRHLELARPEPRPSGSAPPPVTEAATPSPGARVGGP